MTQVQDEEVTARADETLEAQRRRQLMAAAMECVAEVGVARTTMRMIADRAGVTTGMVLYYFRSKKELISAAIAAANEAFSARMNLLTDGAFGPRRLEAILETFLSDPSEGVPRSFTVQYRSASLNDAELRQSSLNEYQAARDKLARSIRSGQEQGELRADIDDMLAADFILVIDAGPRNGGVGQPRDNLARPGPSNWVPGAGLPQERAGVRRRPGAKAGACSSARNGTSSCDYG